MSEFKTANMKYNNLGNSGLQVSAISLGNMFNYKPENLKEEEELVRFALNHGINHFDTAEIYGSGICEEALGKILKNISVKREEIVISTKVWSGADSDLNSTRNTNKKHVREAVNSSLKRLQLDYVDVIYAHAFDR